MYERSAIVLERYMEKILKLNKEYNLKKNNENYQELIHEIEKYQIVTQEELEVIQEFDDTAKEIENLQQEQEKIYKDNKKLEEERAMLFTELGEDAQVLDIKLKQIEGTLEKNNEKLREIRAEFVKYLTDFSQKQKNRNKCEKARRIGEANHIAYLERMNQEFAQIDVKDVASLKDFINFEKEKVREEALEIMIKNGKSEKVNFNQDVLKRAIKVRIDIAEKEAECYILVYEKMKKLLAEQDTETVRLNKYKKTLRDTSVKLAFLNAQREYLVGFLDYERMTAISGDKIHTKMMMEACNNFELYLIQIEKLYELIQREITNRSTKKGYNQLYNKTYLKHIEDKEKNFEQEVNNVNISMGTVINSNYWRIEGIKNIYNVFQEEVSKKFNKDLSEYKLEEPEELEEKPMKKQPVKQSKMVTPKAKKEEHYKQFKYDEEGSYDEEDYEEETYEQEEQEPQKIGIEELEEENETFGHQYQLDDYNFLANQEYDDDNDYDEEDQEENYQEDYEEDNNYEEEYEEENDDEKEEDYEEDKQPEEQPTPIIVARSNRQVRYNHQNNRQDNEDYKEETYMSNNYNNNYYDDNYSNSYSNYNDNDTDDIIDNNSYSDNSYQSYNDNYDDDEEDDYRDNNYEDDYDDEEDEDNNDYYEEEYDEEDNYKAFNTPSYGFKRSPYLDDDYDEEYDNIYEYNYDDDEEEYRRQKLQHKTVISFDDEESIDMIIANSRKRSSNRRGGNKNLFKKLFKK